MVTRLGCKEERERERHGSAVTVAHLLLRRCAEHGQRQQRFRGCVSALLAVHWSEWSGVVVAREGGEMARLGGLFMGEHGLVVDVAQGRSWGVGELAIGGVSARVRSDAVANGEWARRCSSLTMAVVASHACSGRGVARVHAKGREVLRRSGRFEPRTGRWCCTPKADGDGEEDRKSVV